MLATRSPRWASSSVNEMAVNNQQQGGLGNWLDFSHGGARPGPAGCYEYPGAHGQFSLVEDCAFVLAADFPDAQGPFVMTGYPRMESAECGATNSADFLNALGGAGENTPRVSPYSALPCPSLALPDDELPTTCVASKQTGGKASARAPKRGPQARGGRRAPAKKPARGREGDSVTEAPGPVNLLFKGTIGGSGSLQALSLPWTLSLEQLNRTLAPPEQAWPEADS